ncbi:ROK family protein [Jeotgalibaca sp. A127]|uniref:ROK family protein n=1 Tax=Jeotgalibaca sp. A127 TaxID=3457324 RepID=UPI003FD0B1FB
MKILSIDIGGMGIKSDIYSQNGQALGDFKEMPTVVDHAAGTNNILEQVLVLVEAYSQSYELDGVAISSAGVIDPVAGKVIYSGYTIPGYIGTEFKQQIEAQFNIPCFVENDVNSAALGEYWLGAAKGSKSAVCLTIGTGIGGAILLDGTIWHGKSFAGGEVGYLPVNGHNWQDLASTTALCQDYENRTGRADMTGKIVMQAYRNGDEAANQAVNQFVGNFCCGLLPVLYLFNPEKVIIGGGIMQQQDILIPKIQHKLRQQLQNKFFLPDELVAASFGNESGRIGAVYHFLKMQELGTQQKREVATSNH